MATWAVELPSGAHAVGDPNHVEDHNTLVSALEEVRTNVNAAEGTAAWGTVTGKPATFPPTTGTGADQAMPGNTTIPAALPAGTAAQLEAGTDTTARSWTAKLIHDEIARQIAAIEPAV